jgi:eukaryotic-like serine/threonine-protein kinase
MDSISLSSKTRLAGRYRVLRKLGEGSFAETFLAEDEHLPDSFRCVIKKLKTGVEEESKLQIAKRLFDAEARILHQLGNHGQIPQLLAHFEEDGEFCLVEEYVEGSSLYQELAAGQKWSEGYVIHLVRDILDVLKFVHQKHVIHRDIKPSNIIRREKDGRIVLIDFGAVKQVTSQALDDSSTLHAHTVIVGTPGYMPGEQLRGSPRMSSDVYAVGMIAIYALTGLNPALGQLPEDESTAEIVWRDRASISPEFAAILEKMVAYDFRQRYPSATEALDAICVLALQRQEEAPTILKEASGSIGTPPGSGIGSITYNVNPTGSGSGASVSNSASIGSGVGVNGNGSHGNVGSGAASAAPAIAGSGTGSGAVESGASVPVGFPSGSTGSEDTSFSQGTYVVSDVNHAVVRAETPANVPKNRLWRPKMMIVGGGAVVALSAIAALAAPNIEPVCKALGNCTAEVTYRSRYSEAVDAADASEAVALGAKSLKDLQSAQSKLQGSVQQLAKIPEAVRSYEDAKKILPGYQTRLKSLNEKISIEKNAQQDLDQAEAIANKVLTQKTVPQTSTGLLDNKTQLKKAMDRISKIPEQSLIFSNVRAKKQVFQTKIKALDGEISKKEAAEAEQRRQVAARAYVPPVRSGGGGVYVPPQPQDSAPASQVSSGGGYSSGGGGYSGSGGGSSGGYSSSGSGGGYRSSRNYDPAPAPRYSSGGGRQSSSGGSSAAQPQEPLWGSGAPAKSSGSSAPASGGSQEPLW